AQVLPQILQWLTVKHKVFIKHQYTVFQCCGISTLIRYFVLLDLPVFYISLENGSQSIASHFYLAKGIFWTKDVFFLNFLLGIKFLECLPSCFCYFLFAF